MFRIIHSYSGLKGYPFVQNHRNFIKIVSLLFILSFSSMHSFGQEYVEVIEIDRISSTKELPVNMKLYPNPAIDRVILEVEHAQEIRGIKIFTLTGQLVQNYQYQILNHSAKLDVSSLTAGTYLVQIHTERGRKSKKLVVARR